MTGVSQRFGLVSALAMGLFGHASRASVVAYDALTNAVPSSLISLTASPWTAEDTQLDSSAALELAQVELSTRLSSFSPSPNFVGSITVAVFSSRPQGSTIVPDRQLASVTLQRTWTAGVTDLVTADFFGLVLPSRSVWIAWRFSDTSGVSQLPAPNVPFVRQTVTAPTVGMTTNADASARDGAVSWTPATGRSFVHMVRVNSIPAPAAGVLLGLGVLALGRRVR